MNETKYNANYSMLSESEKAKVQKRFHEDDLSYYSSYAVENGLLKETDINELLLRIDKRSGNSFFQGPGILVVLSAVFLGLTVFFMVYENSKTHPSQYQVFREPIQNLNNISLMIPEDMEPVDKVKPEYHREHFSIQHSGEQITIKETDENMPVKEITQLEVPVATVNEEPLLNYIPNAPVIFIKDLKVANYKSYYFKNNQSIDVFNTGVSAQFENKNEIQNNLLNKINERNVYAHEIIKEAMINFEDKDYGNCIASLELLLNYNKHDVNALFYSGMSFFYLGNYHKAQYYFDETLNNDINVFQQEAEFYKALCLLRNKKPEEAKALLSSIVAKKMFYSKRAFQESEKIK